MSFYCSASFLLRSSNGGKFFLFIVCNIFEPSTSFGWNPFESQHNKYKDLIVSTLLFLSTVYLSNLNPVINSTKTLTCIYQSAIRKHNVNIRYLSLESNGASSCQPRNKHPKVFIRLLQAYCLKMASVLIYWGHHYITIILIVWRKL